MAVIIYWGLGIFSFRHIFAPVSKQGRPLFICLWISLKALQSLRNWPCVLLSWQLANEHFHIVLILHKHVCISRVITSFIDEDNVDCILAGTDYMEVDEASCSLELIRKETVVYARGPRSCWVFHAWCSVRVHWVWWDVRGEGIRDIKEYQLVI